MPALKDVPDAVKDDVQKLYRKVRAHKGHFGRFQRAIFTGIKQYKDQGNEFSDAQYQHLLATLAKLETQNAEIERIYDELAELAPANQDNYTVQVTEFYAAYEACTNDVQAVGYNVDNTTMANLRAQVAQLQAHPPAPPPAAAVGGGAAGGAPPPARLKADTSLKPESLTPEFNPVQYRAWKQRFRAYYDSSHCDTSLITVQRAYLNTCLSPEVQAELDAVANAALPIYAPAGAQSCETEIDGIFDRLYPIFVKRLITFK